MANQSHKKLEDEQNVSNKDTVPITPDNHKEAETTPLNSIKGLSKLQIPTGDLSLPKQKDSYSKFRNDSEVEDSNNTDLKNVELGFRAAETESNWSLDTSTASTSATAVKWYKHPKVREHWKVVLLSFILFFIGLGLCITGIILESLQVNLSAIYIFFVVGAVCFIPGVYHLIAVYCAVKGKRGFSFYNLPLFN